MIIIFIFVSKDIAKVNTACNIMDIIKIIKNNLTDYVFLHLNMMKALDGKIWRPLNTSRIIIDNWDRSSKKFLLDLRLQGYGVYGVRF